MIEILSLTHLLPAVVSYLENGTRKDTIVYVDFASRQIIPTEDVESPEQMRQAVFAYISKNTKPVSVPSIPKHSFDLDPRAFNNSD